MNNGSGLVCVVGYIILIGFFCTALSVRNPSSDEDKTSECAKFAYDLSNAISERSHPKAEQNNRFRCEIRNPKEMETGFKLRSQDRE